jgi:aryl-alcohol dehydrogenase-like predicted oxidoreductase
VNLFDTLDTYGQGTTEQVTGVCLRQFERSSYVLTTKAWAAMRPGSSGKGPSAKDMEHAREASLKQLGVDFIYLYQCHRPGPETLVDETIRAIEDLAREGRMICWGISE